MLLDIGGECPASRETPIRSTLVRNLDRFVSHLQWVLETYERALDKEGSMAEERQSSSARSSEG
jgi:hypothetical protein